MTSKTLGLIFGGRSGEHEISIISARSIAQHIDNTKYSLKPIYITQSGEWINPEASEKILAIDFDRVVKSASEQKRNEALQTISNLAEGNRFSFDFQKEQIDVVFPCLHGPYGEDGTVQGLLDMHKLPYVGCDVLSSAITMDKAMSKICFSHAGLNITDFLVFYRHNFDSDMLGITALIETKLGYPVFVKPANMGSSVGISKVKSSEDLQPALELAATYDRKIVVEKGLEAREFEVAVLGNQDPIASPVGEIVPCNEFYDFNAKYVKGTSKLFIPAEISESLSERLRDLAIKAYKATACEGMARVDFLMDKHNDTIYINEINTIPGFTSISMFPKLFAHAGIAYPDLIDRLIQLAIARYDDKSNVHNGKNSLQS